MRKAGERVYRRAESSTPFLFPHHKSDKVYNK